MSEFTREYKVELPFDKRDSDPNKNYGIGSLTTRFILKNDKGAVQFMCSWPIFLPHIDTSKMHRLEIIGYDVGYHSPKPMYESQSDMDCDVLESGKCYYDGSSLAADEWVKEIFSRKDPTPVLWRKLEEYHKERFGE